MGAVIARGSFSVGRGVVSLPPVPWSMTVVGVVNAPHSHHFPPRHNSSEGDSKSFPPFLPSHFLVSFRAMAADWISCPRVSKEGIGRLTAESIPDL